MTVVVVKLFQSLNRCRYVLELARAYFIFRFNYIKYLIKQQLITKRVFIDILINNQASIY